MYLSVVLFGSNFLETLNASWTFMSISFTKLGKFSLNIFSNRFPISCSFSSPYGTSMMQTWDFFKRSNIHHIRVPEREEKEQEIGNLCEKIMKENLPNLVKETDMQAQEAQSPKEDRCKEAHSKIHHN